MSKHMQNVPHLESSDFNSDLTLKNYVGNGRPVVVMCQGAFCGYCTQAKPAFMAFCKESKNAIGCTLQIDEPSAKAIASQISKLDPNYQGVPVYLGFNSSGKYVKTHNGNRDTASILAFANSL